MINYNNLLRRTRVDYRIWFDIWLYDITYHVFEARIDATYHGRGGAVAVGVAAACKAERA